MDPGAHRSDEQDTTEEILLSSSRIPWLVAAVVGAGLAISLAFNVGLWRGWQEARNRAASPPPRCPPLPTCPSGPTPTPAPECPACPACTPVPVTAGVPSPPPRSRPLREDADAAAEGEAHVAAATAHGEHDPVNLSAQRRMVTAIDRIVASRSPAAAERFIQRNLPGLASMDCAFRDPAMAEHVRLRLRELNQLARPPQRLSQDALARYERDLRCPRE